MQNLTTAEYRSSRRFPHPAFFWFGVLCCVGGVSLHLPMYVRSSDMHYRMSGMRPDAPMLAGMALILAGLLSALRGLDAGQAAARTFRSTGIEVRALDDTPIRAPHVGLLVVMALAVTIDVMKPTTLAFVAPGVAKEYGLRSPTHPFGHLPVSWLPLAGITGTVVGSLLWGWAGDRIGRRSSIIFAGLLFVSTSICGAMPGFSWNILMCFLMGIGAGGMLPVAFALIAETIPARHRSWLIVLIGGDVAGAYVLTSWLAGALTPQYSWRIMWLLGMPTGLLLIALHRWMPESPRYLLATGQQAEAEAVMRRYGTVSVVPASMPPVGQDGLAAATVQQRRRGYRQLFHRPHTGSSIALSCLGIAIGLLTYGFQFWVPSNLQRLGLTDVNSDFVLRNSAIAGLPLTVAVALLYGFWSSRGTIMLLSLVTAVSVLAFAVAGESVVDSHALLTVLLIVPLSGISSMVAVVTAYSSELYPTNARGHGTGLAAGATKVGGVAILALAVAGVTNPSLVATAVVGAVPLLVATAIFARTAPETHQLRLEEIVAGQAQQEHPVG